MKVKSTILLLSIILSCCALQVKSQSYVPLKNDTRLSVQPQISIKAYAFPLKDIRLLDGPFKTAMEADKRWLMQLNSDRFLHRFHANAGLSTKAAIYGGWENTQASGHSFGHYISALSMLYAATGDNEVKERVDYIITELKRCQDARATGYVGGIPDEDKLWTDIANGNITASGFELNGLWVPWYTLHKLWAGLLDAYFYTENETAKTIAVNLTNWACEKFKNLTDAQWQQIITCEIGGMNDALYNIYAITGEQKHLDLAEKFYHKAILDPLTQQKNELIGKHANTQIPKVTGASRSYELTGNQRDKTIAEYFWDIVVHDHSYCIGGNSNYENFSQPGQMSGELSNKTAETCNTYNMLKLTRHLFAWNPTAEYMDYYERALYNHILASQNPETGMVCYSVSLGSNTAKEFSTAENSFWCCVGTGFENHVKYAEEIYSQAEDGIYINLFIASEINWKEKGMKITQETTFPDSDKSKLKITTATSQNTTFYIRYPSWVTSGYQIKINGTPQNISNQPGSYVAINRMWKNGDTVEIEIPKTLQKEGLLGDEHKRAFLNGPIVLAGEIETAKTTPVFMDNGSPISEWIRPQSGSSNTFRSEAGLPEDITLIPFYKKYKGLYSVYFDCFTSEEWEEIKEEYEKEQEKIRELELLTLDYFRPNEQQQEVDHKFTGTNVDRGEGAGRKWCDTDGGYFQFEMQISPDLPADLLVTYWGSDSGGRKFDILIDEELIAVEELMGKKPNEFFDTNYPIPYHLTKGKEKITVKFRAYTNNKAGGIFGTRTMLKKDISDYNIVINDFLLPQQPYLDEHGISSNIRSGVHMGHPWIDDNNTGGFSFQMVCSKDDESSLLFGYWGGEPDERNFNILVDNEIVGTQKLHNNKPDEIFEVAYKIPKNLTNGKEIITVMLEPVQNTLAGGLWYAYTFSKGENTSNFSYVKSNSDFISVYLDQSEINIKNQTSEKLSGRLLLYSMDGQIKYTEDVIIEDIIKLKKKPEQGVYIIQFIPQSKSISQKIKIIL